MQYQPDFTPPNQLVSDLINVRNLLSSPWNWSQRYWGHAGTYCLMGAMYYVVTGDAKPKLRHFFLGLLTTPGRVFNMTQAVLPHIEDRSLPKWKERLVRAIWDFFGPSWFFISAWNDDKFTTHEQLLQTLDRTIAAALKNKKVLALA